MHPDDMLLHDCFAQPAHTNSTPLAAVGLQDMRTLLHESAQARDARRAAQRAFVKEYLRSEESHLVIARALHGEIYKQVPFADEKERKRQLRMQKALLAMETREGS